MKLLLPALTLITAMTIGTSAQAQNYPWCAQYGTGMGGMNCGFISFAQCMATVSGIGGNAIAHTTSAGDFWSRARSNRMSTQAVVSETSRSARL